MILVFCRFLRDESLFIFIGKKLSPFGRGR